MSAAVTAESRPDAAAHPSNEVANQTRVLLVEDHADARAMLARLLESLGFQVDQAEDGLDALRQVARMMPDVILMDLNMPEMDGYEAIRRLKEDGRWSAIPVLVLTANVSARRRGGRPPRRPARSWKSRWRSRPSGDSLPPPLPTASGIDIPEPAALHSRARDENASAHGPALEPAPGFEGCVV